ncbi:MAG: hypothetical protein ACYTA3_00555, partial [Planctomycetota bacterium]
MSTRFDHALVVGVVTTLSACAQPPGPPPVSDAATENVQEALAVSPRTASLGEQARRDVEQLRELDRDRAPATGPEPDTASRRPDIEWILPASPRRAAVEPPARPAETVEAPAGETAGDSLAGQEALGRAGPSPAERPQEEPGGSALPAPESDDADRLRRLIVELSSELYRRGAYSDMPLRELLLIAATTMVTPDRALATDALPGVTERERELLAKMQEFFSQVGVKLAETGDPEVLVAEVDALHLQLSRQPQLVVAQASLCTRVGGFGDYDEFSRNVEGHYA